MKNESTAEDLMQSRPADARIEPGSQASEVIKSFQAMVNAIVPRDTSLVDELIEERERNAEDE